MVTENDPFHHKALLSERARRWGGVGIIVGISIVVHYHLGVCLVSRYYCREANRLFHDGCYGLAARCLEKAAEWDPAYGPIFTRQGEAYLKTASFVSDPAMASQLAGQSRQSYQKAVGLNPLSVESIYGLAKAESVLETLRSDSTAYAPESLFRKAVQLRPNSIQYRYALIKYLASRNKTDKLLPMVADMARIYPDCVAVLKKEPFWSPEMKTQLRMGLAQSIQQGICIESAHRALSSLAAGESDWQTALNEFRQALENKVSGAGRDDYMRLGHLFLKARQIEDAGNAFIRSLHDSHCMDTDLERIYQAYRGEKASEALIQLFQIHSPQLRVFPMTNLLIARSYMDLKEYRQARLVLDEMNRNAPRAEAFYQLARIDQFEKQWDAMELHSQKATVLDPTTSRYHLLFSQALIRQGKLQRAESEAGLALKAASRPSAGLYHHRARIRWKSQNFSDAAADWKSAIELSPRNAGYYARAGEAYARMGHIEQAIGYLSEATGLASDPTYYRKRYRELKCLTSPGPSSTSRL